MVVVVVVVAMIHGNFFLYICPIDTDYSERKTPVFYSCMPLPLLCHCVSVACPKCPAHLRLNSAIRER